MDDHFRREGAPPAPECSRPVAVGTIRREGTSVAVEAVEGELAPIARRLDIPALGALRCRWTLRTRPGLPGWFDADGVLEAVVTRVCVVTLEPFEQTVGEVFPVVFAPADGLGEEDEDDDPDAPDVVPYDGRSVDLGEATVEQLALTLDPFPRSPEAERAADPSMPQGEAKSERVPNPFAALLPRVPRN